MRCPRRRHPRRLRDNAPRSTHSWMHFPMTAPTPRARARCMPVESCLASRVAEKKDHEDASTRTRYSTQRLLSRTRKPRTMGPCNRVATQRVSTKTWPHEPAPPWSVWQDPGPPWLDPPDDPGALTAHAGHLHRVRVGRPTTATPKKKEGAPPCILGRVILRGEVPRLGAPPKNSWRFWCSKEISEGAKKKHPLLRKVRLGFEKEHIKK